MTEQKKELTVEEKKAAAAAAKKAAQEKRDQEKKDAETKKADAKNLALQEKRAEAIKDIGGKFTELQTLQANVQAGVGSLTGESTVEQVNGVIAQVELDVKSAKAAMQAIKVVGRKFKDDAEIQGGVSAAEAILTAINGAVDPLKENIKAAKQAQKDREKAEAKAKRDAEKAANAMPSQNGVTRPRPDTACGKAWALMDKLTERLQSPAPIALVLQAAEKEGLVYDTVKTQYARWKKFNGYVGRIAMPTPAGLLD